MTAYRTFFASFLALVLVVGAPVAAWGGDADAPPCLEQSSGEAAGGCCEGDGVSSACEMVCAAGFAFAAGTPSSASPSNPATALAERRETAAGIAPRAPDTAPPKLRS